MEYLQELLRAGPKDHDAFNKLQIRYQELVREKERYRLRLNLLEQAIRQDYDSMMIITATVQLSDAEIVYVNDAFSKMTGYSEEEIIGMSPRILQGTKTDIDVLNKQHTQMKKGQSFVGETVHYRKDRSAFMIQWDIHPLSNEEGDITHWISYQRDITGERDLDNDRLFTQEKAGRMIADMDTDGNFIRSNKAFLSFIGVSGKELDTKNIRDFITAKHLESFIYKIRHLHTDPLASSPLLLEMRVRKEHSIEVSVVFNSVSIDGKQQIRTAFENRSLHKRIKSLSELQVAAIDSALSPNMDHPFSRN